MLMHRIKCFLLVFLCSLLVPQLAGAGTVSSVLLTRADDYYAAGRYLEALSVYRDCAENSKSNQEQAAAFFGLGLLYDQYLDDGPRALDYYNRHSALAGVNSARALHYSARILFRQSHMEEARNYYDRLLQRYPEYASKNSVQQERNYCAIGTGEPVGLFDRERIRTMPGTVRVLIVNGSDPVTVEGSPGLYVARQNRKELWEYCDLKLVFHADNDSLFVNNVQFGRQDVIMRGGDTDILQVNGRRYRSRIRVSAEKGCVQVVNYVCLDHYLYGVLPHEIYASWPAAALRAQAVAARTYALYHMLVRRKQSFDVLSTTSSQVYGGLDREHPATNRAVDATSGLILFNGRQLALTLYHANSGGVVESVEDVWGARLPHLQRVMDIASLQGRHAEWSRTLDIFEVVERLGSYGLNFSGFEGLEVVKRSPSGRVEKIALKGQGTVAVVSGNSLRLMLGPSVVKSTRFIVDQADGAFRFTGTGFGHGVGMSQWGAYALAKEGADYTDILKHYYPGTVPFVWERQGNACSEAVR